MELLPITGIMQRDVRTISPDASVRLAARIMRQEQFGCLPVVSRGKLVGIVTEADLLRVLESLPDAAATHWVGGEPPVV